MARHHCPKLARVSDAPTAPPYRLIGPQEPVSPVILSIPHAGRDYPPEMTTQLRVPLTALIALEDRHVDAVGLAALGEETALIATRARAWIDLNRSEAERDPAVESGGGLAMRLHARSAKVRGGLGLIPRRAGSAAAILSRRLEAQEVEARILIDHRPYHAQLALLLERARRRFGGAVLIDLHSMPTIRDRPDPPRIVIGDRFGQSASAQLVARIEAEVESASIRVSVNTPYSGGYILDRHGAPARGVHAVQIEIDRACYLDGQLDQPGPGVARMARMVRCILDAARDELWPETRIAAE